MKKRSRYMSIMLAGVASLSIVACGPPSSVYVGVSAPGPWYGYPGRYPGMYPGGGVWVGVPVCCEDMDAMAEPAESGPRYAETENAPTGDGRWGAAATDSPAARVEQQAKPEAKAATGDEDRKGG